MVDAFMWKHWIVILGVVVKSVGHGTLVRGCIHFWNTKVRKFWCNLGFVVPNVWHVLQVIVFRGKCGRDILIAC